MNGSSNYLVVGAFVSAALVALIAMILSFAGDAVDETSQRYIVFFERDVSGLTLGAPVRYLGVDVGQVGNIGLSARSNREVRVDIDIRESTPVSTATYASLAFQGVTGVAFISLSSDPELEEATLSAAEFDYPVIPVRATGFAALLASGPELTDKASTLLDRANLLLGEDNQESLSRSLANIVEITAALADEQEQISALPGQLRSALQNVEDTLGQLQSTLSKAEPDILATLERLGEASDNLASVSMRLDRWLAENDDAMNEFIEGGIGQAPALISDTRDIIRELEKLLADLRENPSQIVYKPQQDAVAVDP